MTTPSAPDARLFFRFALQRHDDAQVLLRYDHTTGAVYLAGYGVECILKALILSGVPRKERDGQVEEAFHAFAPVGEHEPVRDVAFKHAGLQLARFVLEDRK